MNLPLLDKYSNIDKNLSIIIPVYNCKDTIIDCIKSIEDAIDDITKDYEIIIVDDGSIDNTTDIIKSYRDHRIRLISYHPNVGKGYAIKQGVMTAKGSKIIFIDGDMDINPALLRVYYHALDDSDLVIGSKYHPASSVDIPFFRYLLSRIFNMIVNILLDLKIRDTQVGLKAGRRDVFKNIFNRITINGYAFDVEMLTIANLLSYKIVEMPVCLKVDNQFRIDEMLKMLIDTICIAYRLKTRWYERELCIEHIMYKVR